MKNNYLILIFAALVLFVSGCNSKKKNVPTRHIPTEKELAAFEAKVNSISKTLNIKSLSYAIVNEEGIIQAKSIGADENTVYPVGNLSNIFTSAIVLQLAEANKINLKGYVADYSSEAGYKSANLKQLLSFTASDKPGSRFQYNPSSYDLFENIITSASEKKYSDLFRKNITRNFKMKNTSLTENAKLSVACNSTVSDLSKFSLAIDKNELFEDKAMSELMFRPVYLSNGEITPSALGWFVQFYNDKKYVWSFGQGKNFSSLIVKSLTDSITLIVLANSENMNAPFNLNNSDVFASPYATEFLKTFILYKDTLPLIDYSAPIDSIQSALAKCNKSKHRDILIKEYLSNINIYNFIGDTIKSRQLSGIFNKALPLEVPYKLLSKEPRAIIKDAGDYVNLAKQFQLVNDTVVNVFGVGEFTKEMQLAPYEYDIAELYLDLKNTKKKNFDNTVDRQYRFDYDYSEVTGNFSTAENVKFVQGDPSKTSYLFEISIPWKTLNSIKPKDGLKMGFDINVTDNDGTGGRKSFITWHFKNNDQPWTDVSVLGSIILCNQSNGKPNDSLCFSLKANSPLNIDGKVENLWNATPKYRLTRTAGGFPKFPEDKDLSAWFRSEWDENNLYFLVEVTDNFKCKLPNSGDFGWIENENQDTVWMMKPEDSKYAGGSTTNRFVNTTVPLKKGKYTLKYKTNQTNSYGRWTVNRPEVSFYGIAVY